jgi:hypothetical protein
MRNAKVKAVYRIEIRDAKGTVSEATVRSDTNDFRFSRRSANRRDIPP